jgi:hypothetical protein
VVVPAALQKRPEEIKTVVDTTAVAYRPAAGRSAALGAGGRRLVGHDEDRQLRILDQS